jgi:hypothetical protein
MFDANGDIVLPDLLGNEQKVAVFDALVKWVVDDKQSFRVVENPLFKKLMRTLNPLYVVPSRRTLVRGIDDQCKEALQDFHRVLSKIPGRVAIRDCL